MPYQLISPVPTAPQLHPAAKLGDFGTPMLTSTSASSQLPSKSTPILPWEDMPINHTDISAFPVQSPAIPSPGNFVPYSFDIDLPDDLDDLFDLPDAYTMLYNRESILLQLP